MHNELVDLLIAKLPALRAAGARHLQMSPDGFVSVTIAEPDPPTAEQVLDRIVRQAEKPEPVDPLFDEATFGGRGVPGFDLGALDQSDDE